MSHRSPTKEFDPTNWVADKPSVSRRKALASIGSVIYAVRLDGGVIKFGFTRNLRDRIDRLRSYDRSETAEVLAFRPAVPSDEAEVHAALVEHRARGREYYHPTPEVLAVVNEMREALGLPTLAA